jgi:hypothetical protein
MRPSGGLCGAVSTKSSSRILRVGSSTRLSANLPDLSSSYRASARTGNVWAWFCMIWALRDDPGGFVLLAGLRCARGAIEERREQRTEQLPGERQRAMQAASGVLGNSSAPVPDAALPPASMPSPRHCPASAIPAVVSPRGIATCRMHRCAVQGSTNAARAGCAGAARQD